MVYLIENTNNPIDPTNTINWTDALLEHYGEDLFKQTFGPTSSYVFSLFPLIRKLERATRNTQDISEENAMLFAATITDRGLLSAQTRDANMIGPQSYITTRLSYIPVPLPKDRHEECKQICFKETRWMWKVFFYQTSQFEEKFSLLLDAVYQKCPKGHMLHDDMVIFPDGLEWNTEEDKDVFPNEYELKFVEQTRVNKTPALLYFRELAKEYNLTAFCDT